MLEGHSVYFMHFCGMIFLMLCFFILSYVLFKFFHPSIGSGTWAIRRASREDLLALLKNRLAKGEITVEEFENLKSHI